MTLSLNDDKEPVITRSDPRGEDRVWFVTKEKSLVETPLIVTDEGSDGADLS